MPVGVPLENKDRLARLSKVGDDRFMPFGPVVVAALGIAARWSNVNGFVTPGPSCRKWPSSKVDIGCVGYANGSSDGNIIGMRSGTLLKLVNCGGNIADWASGLGIAGCMGEGVVEKLTLL